MKGGRFISVLAAVALCMLLPSVASAQFKQEAFQQNYNDSNAPQQVDTTLDKESLFSFREYRNGITHRSQMQMSTMCIGSSVLVGGCQIYNKQYWKLPIIYTGLAATVGGGIYMNSLYQKDQTNNAYKNWRNGLFISAGLMYWGAMFDGVYNYKSELSHDPSRAMMYSLLVPGLGQIYNGETWKLPIYWGGMIGGLSFYITNKKNYIRYRDIYNLAADSSTSAQLQAQWPHGAETALYYRNVYRRYRDYALLTIAGVYLLQVIDANVFAYMQDFEVNDDLSMRITPTIINSDNAFAMGVPPAMGMSIGFRF